MFKLNLALWYLGQEEQKSLFHDAAQHTYKNSPEMNSFPLAILYKRQCRTANSSWLSCFGYTMQCQSDMPSSSPPWSLLSHS